jgi:hypothetical protein
MRTASLKFVPTAILSRQTAGIRQRCLIVNLPGKPSAIDDCLKAVFPAIPYCIDLIEGAWLEANARASAPPSARRMPQNRQAPDCRRRSSVLRQSATSRGAGRFPASRGVQIL